MKGQALIFTSGEFAARHVEMWLDHLNSHGLALENDHNGKITWISSDLETAGDQIEASRAEIVSHINGLVAAPPAPDYELRVGGTFSFQLWFKGKPGHDVFTSIYRLADDL